LNWSVVDEFPSTVGTYYFTKRIASYSSYVFAAVDLTTTASLQESILLVVSLDSKRNLNEINSYGYSSSSSS
jgi:hypothetical protein